MARLLLRDLTPGTSYKVQIRAVEGDSVSEWSRLFPLTTSADTNAPTPPAWAAVNPWVTSDDTFVATWQAIDTGIEQNRDFSHYEIELGDGVTTRRIKTNNTSYTLTFENNKIFFGTAKPTVTARVRAVDNVGNASAWTSTQSATNPAPSAPTGVTVEQGINSLTVSWLPTADTDLSGYRVYVGTTSGFTPSAANRIFEGDATRTTYGTASIVQHFFKIRAVDKFGQESTDATGSGTPVSPFTADTTAPNTPTALAGNITNNPNGIGSRVALTWTLASPPSDLAGFYVRYRRQGGTNWEVATFQRDNNGTAGNYAGLLELQVAYTNYEFQIKAFDWQNNESAWSSTVTVNAPADTAPANVTGLVSTPGRDSITYNWTAVADTDIKNYEVTFSTSPTFASGNTTFLTGTATTLTVGGLSTGTTYYARVRAVDNSGLTSGAWSSTDTETTGTFPTTPPSDGQTPANPTAPSVMSGLSYLYVTWAPVTTNALGAAQVDPVTYEVHLSTTSGFTPTAGTKVTEVSGTSAIIDNLPGTTTALSYGTTYYVKLVAKDRDGSAAAASGQGSGAISKVASTDVTSIGADLIVPGTGFVNALVVASGGSLQSSNYSSLTAGWKISNLGIEMNDAGSKVKADAIQAGTLGGSSGSGVINIAAGSSLVLNGGYLKSNTYTGTSYNASASAGFYLGNDGLRIAQGAVSAATLTTGDIATASITLSGTAEIKTSGYNGTSGFRLSTSGLEIPDGTITAAKLRINAGVNLLSAKFSSFEGIATSYKMPGVTGQDTGTRSIVTATGEGITPFHGSQVLKMQKTGGTAYDTALVDHTNATETTTALQPLANIPVVPGKTYIVSLYAMSPATTGTTNLDMVVRTTAGSAALGSQTVTADGAWRRYSWIHTIPAGADKLLVEPRINIDGIIYIDAVMVEERLISGYNTPSQFSPNDYTAIDGGMIRTGEIMSTATYTPMDASGAALPAEPVWRINVQGDALFGNAWVRGSLIVGNVENNFSTVKSFNYVQGDDEGIGLGWAINSDGSAEFADIKVTGGAISASALDDGNTNAGIRLVGSAELYALGEFGEKVSMSSGGFYVDSAPYVQPDFALVSSGLVTVYTLQKHGLADGDSVRVTGMAKFADYGIMAPLNDDVYVVDVASDVSFTVSNPAAADQTFNFANYPGAPVFIYGAKGSEAIKTRWIDFPSDASRPNIISGRTTSDTLHVSGNASFASALDIQPNAEILLSSGITTPNTAPVAVGIGYQQSYSWYASGATGFDLRGFTKGPSDYYYSLFSAANNQELHVFKHVQGTPSPNGVRLNIYRPTNLRGSNTAVNGMVFAGGMWWVSITTKKVGTSPSRIYLVRYNSSFDYVSSQLYYSASLTEDWLSVGLGKDNTNTNSMAMVIAETVTGDIRGRLINVTGGTVNSSTITNVWSGESATIPSWDSDTARVPFIEYGNFNGIGSVRWIVKRGDTSNAYVPFNTASVPTRQSGEIWYGDVYEGAALYDPAFTQTGYSATGAFVETAGKEAAWVLFGSQAFWIGSDSTHKYWIGYSYENASGVQTKIGGITSADVAKRKSLFVQASIPQTEHVDAPTKANIWLSTSSTKPSDTSSTWRKYGSIKRGVEFTLLRLDVVPAATTVPTSNGFSALNLGVAIIKTASGLSEWSGDDRMLLGSTTNATAGAGNKPALRIGNPNASHLRVGDNGIISMAGDSTTGTMVLRGSSIEFNVTDGGAVFNSGANMNFKMRAIGDSGAAIILKGASVGATAATANPTSFTAGNTVAFHALDIHSWSGGIFMEDLSGGGGTTATINNSGRIIRTSSSERYKKYIHDLTLDEAKGALDLRAVSYQWRSSMEMGDDRVPGFIAEEAEAAGMGMWVTYDTEGRPDGFRYSELTAAHNVLIKELYAEVESLKAQVAALSV